MSLIPVPLSYILGIAGTEVVRSSSTCMYVSYVLVSFGSMVAACSIRVLSRVRNSLLLRCLVWDALFF